MPESEMQIYRLKIRLQQVEPLVWRRLEVPSDIDLAQLHAIIQVVMGWQDIHLYAFSIDGVEYSDAETVEDLLDDGFDALRAEQVRLNEVVTQVGRRFAYDYDFTDDWEHRIELEAIAPPEPGLAYPRCPAGEGACPPEDVGGPEGYQAFLEALLDPAQPDHQDALTWVGEAFDPTRFDRAAVSRRLDREFPSAT